MIISEIVNVTEARKKKSKRKPDQVRAGEKKPKKSKPTSGGESPHPYQGRLVGN
jgi:phosphosulfolactate phosphohydrolase-like enzyme